MTPEFWRDRRVLVTGHTGFKGGWLCLWLQSLGARVHGFALEAPTRPSLFQVASVEAGMASSTIGDVRDIDALRATADACRPEIVFHLAAQPLVRESYQSPVATFATNVMGVVNLLEVLREISETRAVVNVTTDKCYENREWVWGYRENEPLGGKDPYSASKACAELVTSAYRDSFLAARGLSLASARAGNVIGGGDWAADRLLPDCFRALDAARTLVIRSPGAIRPWQHVLEPLAGYLALAAALHEDGATLAEAWNFGPADQDAKPVEWIVNHVAALSPGFSWRTDPLPQPHEANLLKLDSSKARQRLNWRPKLELKTAIEMTCAWHEAWRRGDEMRTYSLRQIATYCGLEAR